MDVSFLEGLQRFHEDWLFYGNSSYPQPAPILVIGELKKAFRKAFRLFTDKIGKYFPSLLDNVPESFPISRNFVGKLSGNL